MRQETSSLLTEPIVFWPGGKCEELGELLLESGDGSQEANDKFSVLPIIGIGGVEKTTLAQRIYNDLREKEHFQRFTKDMVEFVYGERRSELKNFDHLQSILKEKLLSKKFLIVLEDVWNQDRREWEKLSAT